MKSGFNDFDSFIPNGYQRLKSLPEDPEDCITYGKQTESALFLSFQSIGSNGL